MDLWLKAEVALDGGDAFERVIYFFAVSGMI